MKVLVLNAGSSSLKFRLFDSNNLDLIAAGLIERIGEKLGAAKLSKTDGSDVALSEIPIQNHQEAFALMVKLLADNDCLTKLNELSAIGHRVVHGGEEFWRPTLITQEVIDTIKKLIPLAPLHNPVNLIGIEIALEQAPDVPQVAVFDTAFHQTLPKYAYLYALPYELYENHKIRRYGFHGSSHSFVTKQAARYLGISLDKINAISLHLGAGASASAIKSGKSVDTSLGMTPLEGLIMGTRSGDLDPAIPLFLSRELGMSTDEIDTLLNKKSGLKGICGNNDMRSISENAVNGDEISQIAIEMFAYRAKKYIGAYLAALGHTDAIIFTGGIGENAANVRAKIITGLEQLGIVLDTVKNTMVDSGIRQIQDKSSKIKILIVPTNEELEIASQTLELVEKL